MTEQRTADFVLQCPVPLPPGDHIQLGHGSGGSSRAN